MRRVLPLTVLLAAACGGSSNAPAITMPSPDAHASLYFPANAASVHSGTTCGDCHDPQATSFAQFDCLHCHTGAHADQTALTATHAGVAGFELTSAGCYRCHRDGTGVNHVPFFPIASGAHAGVLCSQCHTDPANRKDPATLACAACHLQKDPALATKHTSATVPVVDYGATSAACVKCHADSQVDRGASHPGGESGPLGNSRHRSAGCTTCHSGFRTDKPWAASWSSTPGCVTCHPNGTGGN
ncbi:cytochrome c3 family protein [Anaeromyxobacter oryzae]|uniref:Class III cytochrome C domain-containing protein n=1 Tax=Anaeromyxobacter oryzae TaxID=2918170 RepID=A0ABN6MYI3_9BACT|nr:cytochrome c3 family protein [Anaeromyxobacter oryzae]BDG05981.1 hypothetical protein AMOR_49770 [Anaeromyxobacter oryzae]